MYCTDKERLEARSELAFWLPEIEPELIRPNPVDSFSFTGRFKVMFLIPGFGVYPYKDRSRFKSMKNAASRVRSLYLYNLLWLQSQLRIQVLTHDTGIFDYKDVLC
jgi:hypothetical protein